MDRTIDRTIMHNYRAEEKELSDKVHFKIESLTLINAPSEEFKNNFVKDMFLKSNPKGFFLIMHYLFITLDPAEFKKRFYWPIADKRSETSFRSSTVDYLNYLNKKHNLHNNSKTNINYLVLMPGGHKFLTFLNDFLDFIAGEMVKQHEKYLLDKMQLKELNLDKVNFNKLKKQREYLKTSSLQYFESLEDNTKKIKEKTDLLRNQFLIISKMTEIPLSVLMDREFIENFLKFGKYFLKEKITKKVDEFVSSEKNIIAIQEKINIYEIQKSEVIFDLNKLVSAFNNIKIENPNVVGNILLQGGYELNFEILVGLFDNIIPDIQNLLSNLDQNLLDTFKFEENELSKINSVIIKLDNEITKFSNSINDDLRLNQNINIKTTPYRFKLNTTNDLRSKFMNTPPISNFCNNGLENCGVKMRLSLMDDYNTDNLSMMHGVSSNSGDYFSFANNQTTLVMPLRTPKSKSRNRNNSTINRSKIMDPSALLRSLTKSKRPNRIGAITKNQSSGNLSTLAMKWKEQESTFSVTSEDIILETNENDESFDFNKSIHSKMMTTIRKKQVPDNKKNIFLDSSKSFLKPIDSPKNNVVQQVQNNSLDFSKLSTSPSGRLESLIKVNQNDLPKILLNDITLNLNQSVNIKDPAVQNDIKTNSFNENYFDLNSSTKDYIFNVSDSILKDIPM